MSIEPQSPKDAAVSDPAASLVRSIASLPERAILILAAVLAWALFVSLKGPSGWEEMVTTGVTDSDAVMRLAQIRDLLSGQGFYDLTQTRMNAPFGLEMHWSRLIDVSIAGLILLGNVLFGPGLGEPFAMTVWPLLVLLPTLLALCFICREVGGMDAILPCLVFTMASPRTFAFVPGQIDHHNVQIMLCLILIACVVTSQRLPKLAAIAGAIVGLTLSIGLESIAFALICSAWYPILWVLKGQEKTEQMAYFGAGLLASTLLLSIGLFVPSSGFQAYCDVFSFAYIPALALGAGGLLALAKTSASFEQWQARLSATAALGALSVLSIAAIAPECLHGPYAALTPELREIWFNRVAETQGFLSMIKNDPKSALAFYPYLVLAIACGTWALWRSLTARPRQTEGLAFLLAMLSAGFLLGLLQVRAVSITAFFAIPVFAIVAAIVREFVNNNGQSMRGLFVLIFVWVAGTNATWIVLANQVFGETAGKSNIEEGSAGCGLPHELAVLGQYPTGVVINGVDLGPWLAAHTKHGAVSGPYHRNESGILDAHKALTSEPDQARKIIDARRGSYVAWCAASAGGNVLKDSNHKGLVAQVESGNVPSWLIPITDRSKTGLRLFKVLPAAAK